MRPAAALAVGVVAGAYLMAFLVARWLTKRGYRDLAEVVGVLEGDGTMARANLN